MSPLEDETGLLSSFEDTAAASRAPKDNQCTGWNDNDPEPTISCVRRRSAASRTPRTTTISQED